MTFSGLLSTEPMYTRIWIFTISWLLVETDVNLNTTGTHAQHKCQWMAIPTKQARRPIHATDWYSRVANEKAAGFLAGSCQDGARHDGFNRAAGEHDFVIHFSV